MNCKLCGAEATFRVHDGLCQPCFEGSVGCTYCGQTGIYLVKGTTLCHKCSEAETAVFPRCESCGREFKRSSAHRECHYCRKRSKSAGDTTVGEVLSAQDAILASAKVFRV